MAGPDWVDWQQAGTVLWLRQNLNGGMRVTIGSSGTIRSGNGHSLAAALALNRCVSSH